MHHSNDRPARVVKYSTCYKEGGLQCNMGPSEAAADTPVGPGVPGFDLGDQQCAVGEQDHTGGGEGNKTVQTDLIITHCVI